MTLEEAIEYYVSVSKEYEEKIVQTEKYTEEYRQLAEEHRQLAEWLIELKKYREKDRYNNYDICLGGFHND